MASGRAASPLPRRFYAEDTVQVARALLGKTLVLRAKHSLVAAIISETEAYCGPNDLACHASKGRSKRTEVMFGPPGHWYIYLIYGMYHCLNVVTEAVDYPAAVLIRGVIPVSGIPGDAKTDGPGKLCRAYGIDRTLNTTAAFGSRAVLSIQGPEVEVPEQQIAVTPRIGVDYAGPYREKPWRFIWKTGENWGQ